MEKIKLTFNKVRRYLIKNKFEVALVFAILLIGSLLRLYKINEYMTFLGDEGRDAMIVRRLLVYFDPILIGPGTSIGNMYLGPLYYYLIAPALFLANYSPAGPSILVALIGIATIYLVYHVGKSWFSMRAGLIAAFLYAISPTVIIYSRSSWNPNVMPFFALLCIYSIWKVWKKDGFAWLIALGISFAFVLQSHYLGLLLAPTLFIFWLVKFIHLRKLTKKDSNFSSIRSFYKYSLIGGLIFLFLMSPLVIFDIRHGGMNLKAISKFFAERQTTVSAKPWNAIPKLPLLLTKITSSILTSTNKVGGEILLVVMGVLSVLFVKFKKLESRKKTGFIILFTWIGFALLGLGLYKQEIYDHYYGFIFAAFFLLFAALVDELLVKTSKLQKLILYLSLITLTGLSFYYSPVRNSPNMQMQRSMQVAEKIITEANGSKFNLAVIAERNYEDGYQYFLEKENAPVVEIDAQIPSTTQDTLFVVCELPKEKCDPTHNPKAEVANFGWSKIDNQWEVFGVTVYKLSHLQ